MKTKVLLTVTLLAGLAASAQAAGITGTKHDLSSTTGGATSIHAVGQNQTCVFCHAPHNATTAKLLWNRNYLPGSGMKIYTSYNTLAMRTAMGATQNSLNDDSSSLLCLSCHSLATTAEIFSKTSNAKGGDNIGVAGSGSAWGTTGSMNNLTNDHPVGIPYQLVIAAGGAVNDVASITGAKTATTGGLRLFKSSISDTTMECASCHSVHDNTNGKFLAKNNDSSNLCKTCHIK